MRTRYWCADQTPRRISPLVMPSAITMAPGVCPWTLLEWRNTHRQGAGGLPLIAAANAAKMYFKSLILLAGAPYGNRTRVSALRGPRPNR
jgi:hypothetical protein